MAVERGIHSVDITLSVDGLLLRGEEHTNDMYASIDGAIDNIDRQIKKLQDPYQPPVEAGRQQDR